MYARTSVRLSLILLSFRLRGNSEIMIISLTMNSNRTVKNSWSISCKMVLKLIRKKKSLRNFCKLILFQN